MINKICPAQATAISRSVRTFELALVSVLLLIMSEVTFAGGPWVLPRGSAYFALGYSRKTADAIWSVEGKTTPRTSLHDFRYYYFTADLGLAPKLSASFLLTYLDGFEGPQDDMERNTGLSDAWVSLKYRFKEGTYPMAISAALRTPILYDISGAYSRNLYDNRGNMLGHSPEWRGLLKHDLTFSYHIGRSLPNRGWTNAEIGFTWREGAPANQIPFPVEAGYGLPLPGFRLKGSSLWVFSLGNDSPRAPEDRFGFTPGGIQNFNDASMGRLGASLLIDAWQATGLTLEIGYNQWIWGRSARQYKEPFIALSRGI